MVGPGEYNKLRSKEKRQRSIGKRLLSYKCFSSIHFDGGMHCIRCFRMVDFCDNYVDTINVFAKGFYIRIEETETWWTKIWNRKKSRGGKKENDKSFKNEREKEGAKAWFLPHFLSLCAKPNLFVSNCICEFITSR